MQIVDAGNPLNFWCKDMESYVLDIGDLDSEQGPGGGLRRNLLILNKSVLQLRSSGRQSTFEVRSEHN